MQKKFWLYWSPVIFYSALIWTLSSFSHLSVPVVPEFRFRDKCFHFLEYAVLGLFVVRLFLNIFSFKHVFAIAVLTASFYGVSDEIHQYFVPGRCVQISDIVADTIGATFGAWLFLYYHRKKDKNVRMANGK